MASPRSVQDTVDFVRPVELLNRMATAKDSDGTARAFTKVTLSYTDCKKTHACRSSSPGATDHCQMRHS